MPGGTGEMLGTLAFSSASSNCANNEDCSLMCWGCPCGCQEILMKNYSDGKLQK